MHQTWNQKRVLVENLLPGFVGLLDIDVGWQFWTRKAEKHIANFTSTLIHTGKEF